MANDITYQTHIDAIQLANLKNFEIVPSKLSKKDVFANVNYNVFYQMNCDKDPFDYNGLMAAKHSQYQKLLIKLNDFKEVRFLTAHAITKQKPKVGEVLCQIRHDVDADIVSALLQAKIENQLGIQSTFFLLHTSPYYGQWKSVDKKSMTFERNENLAEVYLEIQSLGHEVALHTDPMHIYQNIEVNGAEIIVEELRWLRSIGLDIKGTAPHNNPECYGASNSSIFKGRDISSEVKAGPKGVFFEGKWAQIGILDEIELGLEYEADDVNKTDITTDFLSIINKDRWQRYFRLQSLENEYLNMVKKDNQINLVDFLVQGLPDILPTKESFWLPTKEIPDAVLQRTGKICVLSIHPEYYGWRKTPQSEPLLG